MVSQELLHAAKLRLRKTGSDALDDDIRQLADAAVTDLRRIGVADRFLTDCSDPLIREAILTFVKANYAANPDSEKLMKSYDMYLIKIKGGKYGK